MKVLLFADLHGSKTSFNKIETKAKKAGLLICLGDFTIFGREQRKHLGHLNSFNKLCLLIHGNHEHAPDVEKDCHGLKNIIFIDKKILRIGHLIFIGYGGGGFSLRDMEFEKKYVPRFIASMAKYKENIVTDGKEPKIVLLVHGPPYGSRIDYITDHYSGNKSFRDFYVTQKIDYVFCGHIHETKGIIEHINKTTLINPGPTGLIIDI